MTGRHLGVTHNGELFEPALRPLLDDAGELALDPFPVTAGGVGKAARDEQRLDHPIGHTDPENRLTGSLTAAIGTLALGGATVCSGLSTLSVTASSRLPTAS
jgi:hypothetical protein